MGSMDVDSAVPALEQQRKAHPELGELIDEMGKTFGTKLYHQLTIALLDYLGKPPFNGGRNQACAGELLEFFTSFVKPLESKLDKLKWIQILSIVCNAQTPTVALEILEPFEAGISGHRDAKYLWLCLKAEKQTLASNYDDAKDILSQLSSEIDVAYEVDAIIQSNVYKTHMLVQRRLSDHCKFFRSSISYLAFTKLADIPEEERPALAFEICVAALVAPLGSCDFEELLQQDLIKTFEGKPQAWILDVIKAFGEGRFDMYDTALATHKAQIEATPDLKDAEAKMLRPKMAALALMELCFRKPKKQRRLGFQEISSHCRVSANEVEPLVMKSMCEKLLMGRIDEIAQVLIVTWVKPRILDNARIDLMRERMDAWTGQTGLLLEHLEEMTPELLVS